MKSSRQFTAAAMAGLLLVAGCSSSGSKGGQSADASSEQATTGQASTETSGSIDIGLANMDTGTVAFPAASQGAEAAVKYLNASGGIAGKKIVLKRCDMQNSNQAAQKCGQQFANDKAMPFAILPLTLNGGPFYAAMKAANKPVLGGVGVGTADYAPANTYFFYPGAIEIYNSISKFIKTQKAKNVSIVYQDNVSASEGEKTIVAGLKGSGVSVKATSIPSSASDVTPQLVDAGIGSADMTVIAAAGVCPQIAQTLGKLGIKSKLTVATATCLTPDNVKSNPTLYENWVIDSSNKLSSIGNGVDPDVTQFLKGFAKYGPSGAPGTFAEMGWGLLLTAAKMFNGSTPVTTASALKSIMGFKDSVVMGPESASCPGPGPDTATCGQAPPFYKVSGGKLSSYKP